MGIRREGALYAGLYGAVTVDPLYRYCVSCVVPVRVSIRRAATWRRRGVNGVNASSSLGQPPRPTRWTSRRELPSVTRQRGYTEAFVQKPMSWEFGTEADRATFMSAAVVCNADLLGCILRQALSAPETVDAAGPSALARAHLRLLSKLSADVLDEVATVYRDQRLSMLERPEEADVRRVAKSAVVALAYLRHIRDLRLDGLDSAGLFDIIYASATSSISKLSLPRGTFDAVPELVGCSVPSVVELDLSGCSSLADSGLEGLVGSLPQLAVLKVSMNSHLRQPRLRCAALRRATLSICTNLQDQAVETLCAGAPGLQELSLWRCASLVAARVRAPLLEVRRGPPQALKSLCNTRTRAGHTR